MSDAELMAQYKREKALYEQYQSEKAAASRGPSQFSVSELPPDNGVINEGQPIIREPAPQGLSARERAEFGMAPEKTNYAGGQAFLEGAGNEMALGYLPHLQAGVESFLPNPNAEVDAQLAAQGFQLPQEKGYVQFRDENLARQTQQAQQFPKEAMAGKVAGILTTMNPIAKGFQALKLTSQGAGLAARAGGATKMGGVLAGVYNPGDKEGEVDPLQIADRAKNAAIGAGTGVLFQGAGEMVSGANSALRAAPKTLNKASEEFTFRALGPTMKDIKKLAPELVNDLSKARGKTTANQISKTLLDNGIVEAGDTAEDIFKKSTTFKDQLGQKLDDIYTQVDSAIKSAKDLNPFQRNYVAKNALDGRKAAISSAKKIKASMVDDITAEFAPKAQKAVNELKEMGTNIDIKRLRKIKTNLDQDIKYHITDKAASDQQKQLKIIRKEVAKMIENYTRAADKVLGEGSDLVKALKETNKQFSHVAAATDIVEDQLTRNLKNQAFSLTDKMMGAGAMAGSLATGMANPVQVVQSGMLATATALASKYGRKYAAPMAAKIAKRWGERLKEPANFAKFGKPLLEAAKRSPEEFQATLQQFAQDPKFIQLSGAK